MYRTLIVQNVETWAWRHFCFQADCVPSLFSIEMQHPSIFGLVLHHDRKTHIVFQVTCLKVKVIMTDKQTIISSAIAMNIFNVNTYYFIFQQ